MAISAIGLEYPVNMSQLSDNESRKSKDIWNTYLGMSVQMYALFM